MLVLDQMQEAVAVTTAIQEEIFLEMGIGNLLFLAFIGFFDTYAMFLNEGLLLVISRPRIWYWMLGEAELCV